MEVRSPGALLSTIKVADLQELKGAHESRNPMIARVLKDHKYMRELGEGMRRIFEAMQQNDLEKPQLVSSGSSFSVVLSNRSVFSQREEDWLSMFHSSGLSRLQKRIVVAGMDGKELSPDNIFRAMNAEDRDTYDFEITGLRKSGVLDEIRSSPAAQQLAKNRRIAKSKIARFKVRNPAWVKPAEVAALASDTRSIPVPSRASFIPKSAVFSSGTWSLPRRMRIFGRSFCASGTFER
jgi:ATP-dependent DNA helicase RecG